MKNLLLLTGLSLCLQYHAQTNYSLSFNGSNQSVDLGADVANNIRSLEFWFKPAANITSTNPESISLLFRNTGQGENGEFGMYFGSSTWSGEEGHVCFYTNVGGTRYVVVSNSNTWAAGVWHHVAGVIEAGVGMKMYIDGVLQNSTNSFDQASEVRTETTKIATWGDANIRYFNGEMDELRFWDKALTATEIDQHACSVQNPGTEAGLVAYYKMNEGQGTELNDQMLTYYGTNEGATYVLNSNCDPTGLSDISKSENMQLFPNPATSLIALNQNIQSYEVLNSLGQVISAHRFEATESHEISVKSFENGVYLLRLSTTNEDQFTVSVLVQH